MSEPEPQPVSREQARPPLLSPQMEEQYVRMMERIFARLRDVAPSLPTTPALQPWELSKEDEEVINKFMELMNEEIEKYAKDLIRAEIRDKIVRLGPRSIKALQDAIKTGKKPKLKRKKGCIFLQFGEGTPDDPIDELLIAST